MSEVCLSSDPNTHTTALPLPDRLEEIDITYHLYLLTVANHLVPEQDAPDVLQDAYVNLLRASTPPTTKGSPEDDRRYLSRVVTNAAHGANRRAACRPVDPVDNTSLYGVVDERSQNAISYTELRQTLRTLLSPKAFEAIVLVALEGCSYKDAASLLGGNADTLRTHYRRGIKHLQTAVQSGNLEF